MRIKAQRTKHKERSPRSVTGCFIPLMAAVLLGAGCSGTAHLDSAHAGRTSWSIGYTGLGVGASRFGARVALDLLDRPEAEHLSLGVVRRRSFPWPAEPIRYLGVQLTRRALARADQRQGRRGPWLRLLDFLKLGYDS